MAKFAYNNVKNASINHTPFKLNYNFYSQASYIEDVDFHFLSKSTDKLKTKLKELMTIYKKNF